MINIPPVKSSETPRAELLTDITRTWKVGQVLSATSTQSRPANSNVLLQLGQHLLSTRTPVALEEGQEVKLLVKTSGSGNTGELPLLKLILNEPAPPLKQQAAQKLREFIAVQQSFSQLQQSTVKVLENRPSLPETLRTSLQQLQQVLLTQNKNLNADKLRQLVSNSGIFLENKLASRAPVEPQSLINDVKLQLLKVSEQLRKPDMQQFISNAPQSSQTKPLAQQTQQLQTLISQSTKIDINHLSQQITSLLPLPVVNQLVQLLSTPSLQLNVYEELKLLSQTLLQTFSQKTPGKTVQNLVDVIRSRIALIELGQQVEQSISKITSMQLQPLSRDGDSMVMLLFNLVFKDSHEHFDINVRFQQESQNSDQEQESWNAILSFKFRTLGHVQAQIHVLSNRVSTVFHSELADTAEKIQQLLPALERGLQNAGLEVISLDVRQQMLPETDMIKPDNHLLDENA